MFVLLFFSYRYGHHRALPPFPTHPHPDQEGTDDKYNKETIPQHLAAKAAEYREKLIEHAVAPGTVDMVAGGETAGIPLASWIAQPTNLPSLYGR